MVYFIVIIRKFPLYIEKSPMTEMICNWIQAFILTLKIFLYRLKVFQRPVLDFALLCYERPIETAMLNMESTVGTAPW